MTSEEVPVFLTTNELMYRLSKKEWEDIYERLTKLVLLFEREVWRTGLATKSVQVKPSNRWGPISFQDRFDLLDRREREEDSEPPPLLRLCDENGDRVIRLQTPKVQLGMVVTNENPELVLCDVRGTEAELIHLVHAVIKNYRSHSG